MKITDVYFSAIPRMVFSPEGGGGGGGDPAPAAPAAPEAPPAPELTGRTLLSDPVTPEVVTPENVLYSGEEEKKEGEGDPKPGEEGDDKAKDGEGEKDGEKEEDKDKSKSEEKPEAIKPEDYDLTPPDGFTLDEGVEKEFRELAATRQWSKEDVSALKEMQVKLYEKQAEAWSDKVAGWEGEVRKDKEVGGPDLNKNLGFARAALREFFPEGGRKLLDDTGIGNHPDIVRGLVRLGKAMGEGTTITAGKGGQNTSIVDALYSE